jgi:rhodanese-related sulfurtransferase/glyoxylase-like metal-dependent hydrolase (beta-lactamase superfamily II)
MSQKIEHLPAGVTLLKYPKSALTSVSFLLVDRESGTATVIDPNRPADVYLEDAWRLGARIRHLFLTQLRDGIHPSLLELRERAGATIFVGAWGRPNFDFIPVKEGDVLEYGRVRLRIVETPGHRLEAIVLLLYDRRASDPDPLVALTGETVLCGDVGRPDPAPKDGFGTAELAAMLHRSLHEKILTLPASTRLFPSLDSDVEMFGMNCCTIGAQKPFNPGLQSMPQEEFVRRVSAGMLPDPWPALAADVSLRPASVSEVVRARRAGAQLVDLRDPDQFAAAHFTGSLNLPLMADFDAWAGTVVDRERPIILVAPSGHEGSAATRLAESQFEHVASYLRGGVDALEEHPALIGRRHRISFAALGGRMMAGKPCFVLDTRPAGRPRLGPSVLGHMVPLENLRAELHSVPRGPEIIVCDDTPYRSSAAASVLASEGFESVTEVAGGLALWGRVSP